MLHTGFSKIILLYNHYRFPILDFITIDRQNYSIDKIKINCSQLQLLMIGKL